jgi:hypothetical protein
MPITLNLASQLASAEFWYVHSEGATFGPFTPGQMDELGQQRRLGPQTMVVPAGESNWLPLETYLPVQRNLRTPTSAELEELVGVTPLTSLGAGTNQAAVPEEPSPAPATDATEPTGTTECTAPATDTQAGSAIPGRFGKLKRVLRRG